MLPTDLLRFVRLEVGVRLEQPSGEFFLYRDATPGPKLIWRDLPNRREWRTFCCCRDGEIVPVLIESTISASGRADLPPTGRSSVGFHVRVYDEDQAAKTWTELERGIDGLQAPVTESLIDPIVDHRRLVIDRNPGMPRIAPVADLRLQFSA